MNDASREPNSTLFPMINDPNAWTTERVTQIAVLSLTLVDRDGNTGGVSLANWEPAELQFDR